MYIVDIDIAMMTSFQYIVQPKFLDLICTGSYACSINEGR